MYFFYIPIDSAQRSLSNIRKWDNFLQKVFWKIIQFLENVNIKQTEHFVINDLTPFASCLEATMVVVDIFAIWPQKKLNFPMFL